MVTIVARPVATLLAHPLSAVIFGHLPADQFADLVSDIRERGLQYPLELDLHGRVICGSQRLRALIELGWDTAPCLLRPNLQSDDQIAEHLLKDNVLRRQLTPGQMYRAGKELERIYSVQAEARRTANLPGQTPKGSNGAFGKAEAKVAAEIGTSGSQLRRLRTVFDSDFDDLKDQVDKGLMTVSAGAAQVAERQQVFQAERLAPDDVRQIALRCAKFAHEMERFRTWLNKVDPERYGDRQACLLQEIEKTSAALTSVAGRIEAWIANLSSEVVYAPI